MDWKSIKTEEPEREQWIIYVSAEDAAIYAKCGTPPNDSISCGQYMGDGLAEWHPDAPPELIGVWVPMPSSWPAAALHFGA